MSAESTADVQLQIGHVLFMDVVGYSKLLLDEQREVQQELTAIVRNSEQVRLAEESGKLVRIATGDGMALVFFNSPEAPIRAAVEISSELKSHPQIQLRMGIHSGPVNRVRDVNDQTNIAGAGINIAQRVMDCADAGHILLSKRVADDLAQSRYWRPYLHELGECSVKHGMSIFVVNLYTDEVGNPGLPEKFQHAAAATAHSNWVRRVGLIASVVALIVAIGFGFRAYRHRSAAPVQKSIAVLPFENFSDNKQNAFFADGIQDNILTSLGRIRDLRVISRTSVEKYRGSKMSLDAIAKALGVANILEGSVRREGNRVAVNVQLIDAVQDRHLWANRYDRTVTDSLGLEGELAREIAQALQATLTPQEKALIEQKPTENAAAYEVYLQARQYELKPDTFLQDYRTAEQLYVQAITLDPKFALAHTRLAATCARIYHFFEPTEEWKKRARGEAERALQLQPGLGEAHHALGLCYYWLDRDYDKALREFAIAGQLSPNDTDIPFHIAAIKRRQGKWDDTVADYRRILELDPENANIVRDLLYAYCNMRDWPNARSAAERLLAVAPQSVNGKIQLGYVDFWATGTVATLKAQLSAIPADQDPDGAVTGARVDVCMLERNADGADQALRASTMDKLSYFNGVDTPRSYFAGTIAFLRGNKAGAAEEWGKARDFFADSVKESPDVPDRHAFLGLCCALMGEKERAIAEAKRAVELRPESQDALDGAVFNAILALVFARTGENEQAIALLQHLLAVPGSVDSANYSITVNDLKQRWEWDPIRNNPAFQQLLAQSKP